ncbi:ATP-binding protein [Novosphingobium album (ex Liu et al. 2023)]|uniref:histidine kinase n=1 Tax=Novosphingobium album (ex Liu et al. 2023) TaxID=3031130 RepID=A0ABT5WPC0_9SPHN|nr:ATP-binding protein [Novosphingobium album (ex Liu et al. 2023)]MDE8650773.1 ATP-binding protein [Novosphingobium album (ex Liu et al. 2023)]
MNFPRPRSLMGQMLLAVAVALLLVQSISAVLIYRAQRERFESALLNAVAFRLAMETRGAKRAAQVRRFNPFGDGLPRGLRVEYSSRSPLQAGEVSDDHAETGLREILTEQGIPAAQVVVVQRAVGDDPVARAWAARHAARQGQGRGDDKEAHDTHLLVAGVRAAPDASWMIARIRSPRAESALLRPLLVQTLVIYLVLVGAVALILRRITRPLAALTRRIEHFAATQDADGQVLPSGPDDMRRLIVAHNAMEARIAALLDEKDVMLGAIGHDLKTPLAALRVRIESVEDDTERARMASTIEDIVRTLDDILSLARVGRPSDPRERTELSALVGSVIEEYEDMGEPVEFGEIERVVLELRPTWLRRALRNLIGNALRYGQRARVSLAREGGLAVIRIDDEGPGIPDDVIEAMMHPFTRGDPSRNSETGGAGLGLALARAIADQHGGDLTLSNRRAPDGAILGLTARLALPLT